MEDTFLPLDAVIELLDRELVTLEEMHRLAVRAAEDGCSQAERALLQRDMDALIERLDRLVDQYRRGDYPRREANHEDSESGSARYPGAGGSV